MGSVMSSSTIADSPLGKFDGCIAAIQDRLELDYILFGGSPELSGEVAASPVFCDMAIDNLQVIERAIGSATVFANSFLNSPQQKAMVKWLGLAATWLGDALTLAQAARARNEHDLSFRYARNAYIRLKGEWIESKPKTSTASAQKRRFSKGHKWTDAEREEVEREGRDILRQNRKITRDALASRLGISAGQTSKLHCWLRVNPKAAKSSPAVVATKSAGGDMRSLGSKIGIDIAVDRSQTPADARAAAAQLDDYLDAQDSAESIDWMAIEAEQAADARETKCPINNENWTVVSQR